MIKNVKAFVRSGWAPLVLATALGIAGIGGAQADPLRNYGKSLDRTHSMSHAAYMRHMRMKRAHSTMHRARRGY